MIVLMNHQILGILFENTTFASHCEEMHPSTIISGEQNDFGDFEGNEWHDFDGTPSECDHECENMTVIEEICNRTKESFKEKSNMR